MPTPKSTELPPISTPGTLRNILAKSQFFGTKWSKTGAAFCTVGVIAGLYVTDWKVIVDKIPFYRNQFKE